MKAMRVGKEWQTQYNEIVCKQVERGDYAFGLTPSCCDKKVVEKDFVIYVPVRGELNSFITYTLIHETCMREMMHMIESFSIADQKQQKDQLKYILDKKIWQKI